MLIGKIEADITYFNLAESGGTSDEVSVMGMEQQPLVKITRVTRKTMLNKVRL